jgi:hypothetical protein
MGMLFRESFTGRINRSEGSRSVEWSGVESRVEGRETHIRRLVILCYSTDKRGCRSAKYVPILSYFLSSISTNIPRAFFHIGFEWRCDSARGRADYSRWSNMNQCQEIQSFCG